MNIPFTKPVSMQHPMFDKLCMQIYESYPNACVLFINEINNPMLTDMYYQYATKLGDSAEEGHGWHGTKADIVPKIVMEGFDPAKNKVAAYGLGTYIARDANYSRAYTNHDQHEISYMFYTKFAYATKIQSSNCYNRPIPGADSGCIGVDNVKNPIIYAIPQKEAVIPEFIVAFHKFAQ